jgi:hypothetical protein
MKAKQNVLAKSSEPEKVDAYMQRLKHPLADVVEALRRIILSTDREIGEEVKWNAPTFYTGEMKPFNPKEYKRHLVVFNLYRKDCIRLVFPSGSVSRTSQDCWKAIMPMEEGWRSSIIWEM